MILARRTNAMGLALGCAALLLSSPVAHGQIRMGKEAPTGGAPEDAPRSRLTLSGSFEVDTYSQKQFFLGGQSDTTGAGEFDAFWTQRLTLRPRLILADNVNVTVKMDLARGVWGLDPNPVEGPPSGGWNARTDLLDLQVDHAYLAYRHRGTATRWYLGRQPFAMGNLLVLDEDAPGLQVWRDFGSGLALGVGFAKETEAGTIEDLVREDSLSTPPRTIDGRDADLFISEARLGRDDRGLFLNPFFLYYLDRNLANDVTLFPDGRERGARFHPHISRATVLGVAGSWTLKSLRLDAELDILSGSDRVRADSLQFDDSGPLETHDVNNGDLKGSNLYGRLAWTGSRLEITGTYAKGSGDPDPFRAEGNINSLYTQGHWYLTEVWGNGLTLEDVGIAPQGLANPAVRGYRGLENTTALQVAVAWKPRSNLKIGASYTLLSSTQPLKPWWDKPATGAAAGDGVIVRDEYGLDRYAEPPTYRGSQSTELGSEIDGRIEWTWPDRVTVTLRGGTFSPGPAAGYLINGTEHFQESPLGLRLNVTVPIPEFSLGG